MNLFVILITYLNSTLGDFYLPIKNGVVKLCTLSFINT